MTLRCQVFVSKYLKTRGLAPLGLLVFAPFKKIKIGLLFFFSLHISIYNRTDFKTFNGSKKFCKRIYLFIYLFIYFYFFLM